MISTIQLITYWRDLAIIELPFLDKDKNPSIGDSLPWNNRSTAASSYRISLAILPYTDIIYPLLSLLSPQTETRDTTHYSGQKVSLATFDVDPEGVLLPGTASLHISLAAVKTYEIEGNLQKLHNYHKKAIDAFRQKLDNGKPIDRDRIIFIIDWLQTFLPRGCAFTHEITAGPAAATHLSSAPTQFTLPLNPRNIRGALHGYAHFLLGIKRAAHSQQLFNPTANSPIAAWPTGVFPSLNGPLKKHLVRLKRELTDATCKFWPLPAHEEKERTQIVLEVAAQYLAGYTDKLPHFRNNWEGVTEKLPHQSINGQMMGIVVFSADTKWLHKLERVVTLSSIDHHDPSLEYPLATFAPQAATPLLDALARHEPHDTPYDESVFATAKASAHQISRQLRLRNRLLRALTILRNQLEESINEQPAIEAQLAALDKPEAPHKLVLAHRQIRVLEREIVDLDSQLKKLEKKRTRLKNTSAAVSFDEVELLVTAMEGIEQSIKQKKQEIAKHEGRFGDIVAQHNRDLETSRETLTDSLPQQVIGYHLKELARCFSNDILEQYRCLTIKSPEDVRAIIEKLTKDNFEIGRNWPAPSARAIRGFIARTHSAYRKLLIEYNHLAGQLWHTRDEKKQLLALHKQLFMLYPVRLVPFDRGVAYLKELDAGKLQVAIVDRSLPPHHLLLAHICERFNKVILLDDKQEPIMSTAVPERLREILRDTHKLTEIPSYL